jgi:hypothetical protein
MIYFWGKKHFDNKVRIVCLFEWFTPFSILDLSNKQTITNKITKKPKEGKTQWQT